jgi:hypothetical protein
VSTITIHNLTGDEVVTVASVITEDVRVIFKDADGLFEFADNNGGTEGWQRSSADPTESEKAVLKALIAANGGFDQTSVTVTPPDPPDGAS